MTAPPKSPYHFLPPAFINVIPAQAGIQVRRVKLAGARKQSWAAKEIGFRPSPEVIAASGGNDGFEAIGAKPVAIFHRHKKTRRLAHGGLKNSKEKSSIFKRQPLPRTA